MGKKDHHLFAKPFQRLMAAYDESDDIRADQARFVFYFGLVCTTMLAILFLYYILIQLTYSSQPGLNWPVLFAELSGIISFFTILVLVARGHSVLATHLLISGGLLAFWGVMFLDHGPVVTRLDTIVLACAFLSITPLVVQRHAYLIFVYTLINIPLVWLFMFSQRDGLGLTPYAFFEYLGDVNFALVFMTVTCFTVFRMNRRALGRLQQDIRKRKETEAALKESEERFRELFKMAPLPMAHISNVGRVLDVNEGLTRTMGYSLDEVPTLGQAWERSMPDPALRNRVISQWRGGLERAMADGSEMDPIECELRYLDGSIHTVIVTTRLMAQSIIVGFYDITDRNKAEAARERLQAQLLQSQKLNAIGTLAGGIAHDFNNILSGIIGYAQLALFDLKDSPSTQEKLERILSAGNRAANLVQQILYFNQNHKREIKPIIPAVIAGEVMKLMQASLPSTIEIKRAITSENYVLADATNIHQVLMNLCTNAAHAMKEKGGVLSVTLQDVSLSREDLSHRFGALPGKYLKISVEDTGTGMTKEILEKACDPFFTTKETGKGTGLGLSTVHGITTELGGFISLYSEPGRGTAAHVFIPQIPKPAEIEENSADNSLRDGTERILFVDDEQIQIDLARDMLTHYGYQVATFSDSSAALAHFQQEPDAYDLVITDMTMPKMTGDVLTQEIRSKRPDIPIIMCSGFSEVMNENKAETLGINAFLYKPVSVNNMLETVRKVLDSGR